jgi:hypothetical protein
MHMHDNERKPCAYQVGDIVVCRKYVRRPALSPKLSLQYYYGPYKIIELPTAVTAIIETTDKSGKQHKERVHVEKLKVYFPRDELPPPAILPSDEVIIAIESEATESEPSIAVGRHFVPHDTSERQAPPSLQHNSNESGD